jgi:hypothetical protein
MSDDSSNWTDRFTFKSTKDKVPVKSMSQHELLSTQEVDKELHKEGGVQGTVGRTINHAHLRGQPTPPSDTFLEQLNRQDEPTPKGREK